MSYFEDQIETGFVCFTCHEPFDPMDDDNFPHECESCLIKRQEVEAKVNAKSRTLNEYVRNNPRLFKVDL